MFPVPAQSTANLKIKCLAYLKQFFPYHIRDPQFQKYDNRGPLE